MLMIGDTNDDHVKCKKVPGTMYESYNAQLHMDGRGKYIILKNQFHSFKYAWSFLT